MPSALSPAQASASTGADTRPNAISTRSSGKFSAATVTVVRAGFPVGKYLAYSSL
jgi:hypothetical protein